MRTTHKNPKPNHLSQYFRLRAKGKKPRQAAYILSILARPYHEHLARQRRITGLLKG